MDVLPKISDINNLKDLCKIIVLPLICACYIYQTSFSLDLDGYILSISLEDSDTIKYIKFLSIFLGKIAFASFFSMILYLGLIYSQVYIHNSVILLTVLAFLTFGFVGIFSNGTLESIVPLKTIWYYTSFVVAFFLLAMNEQSKT